jgi:hypothetical protein
LANRGVEEFLPRGWSTFLSGLWENIAMGWDATNSAKSI